MRLTRFVAVFSVLLAMPLVYIRDDIQRIFLGGLQIFETISPPLDTLPSRPAILVFSKTNGFRHDEAIAAANQLFSDIAVDNQWEFYQTENGATFTPDILSRFNLVIFNNTSGNILTSAQRAAMEAYVEQGGSFLGIHAAGGDPSYD